MDDEHSSRPPVGEPHEVDALEQLVGRLLDTCGEVLPLVAWSALMGTLLCLATAMPEAREWIVYQLRVNLAAMEAMGKADGDEAGAVLATQARFLQQLAELEARPAGEAH